MTEIEGEWVLVPREPTEAMRRAGLDTYGAHLSKHIPVFVALPEAYTAMLAAAPTVPGDLVEAVEQRSEVQRLESLVYVPGVLKCAKCGLRVIKSTFSADDGTVKANNAPDHCPNDGAPMWRVTERDAGNEMIDRADELSDRAVAAETALRQCCEALRMICDPNAVGGSTVPHAWAYCLMALRNAERVLSSAEQAPDAASGMNPKDTPND